VERAADMMNYEPTKADWKLYREKLPEWQENYMAKLCNEYAAILTGSGRGSDAFWEIEKRLKQDKKRPGVMVEVKRSEMVWTIIGLLQDGAIQMSNLDEFSDDLKDRIRFIFSDRT